MRIKTEGLKLISELIFRNLNRANVSREAVSSLHAAKGIGSAPRAREYLIKIEAKEKLIEAVVTPATTVTKRFKAFPWLSKCSYLKLKL